MSRPRPAARGAVGQVIDALRSEHGLTRKEFAWRAGLTVTHVGHYEYRRRVLRVTMATHWAHVFGVEPAPLVRAVLQDQLATVGVTLVVKVEGESND